MSNPPPVPPIYEPELAAEVVVSASTVADPRREYWAGTPTALAIVGNAFIPGVQDWYLEKAIMAYAGRQTIKAAPDTVTENIRSKRD